LIAAEIETSAKESNLKFCSMKAAELPNEFELTMQAFSEVSNKAA